MAKTYSNRTRDKQEVKAITYVAPVPIGFEDIPGDSKGYFAAERNFYFY